MEKFVDPYQQEFYNKYGVRTDLAIEAHEVIVEREGPPELPGVIVHNEETEHATISRVTVETDVGARRSAKHRATILPLTLLLCGVITVIHGELGVLVAKEIQWFIEQHQLGPEDTVLVVGLGNWKLHLMPLVLRLWRINGHPALNRVFSTRAEKDCAQYPQLLPCVRSNRIETEKSFVEL